MHDTKKLSATVFWCSFPVFILQCFYRHFQRFKQSPWANTFRYRPTIEFCTAVQSQSPYFFKPSAFPLTVQVSLSNITCDHFSFCLQWLILPAPKSPKIYTYWWSRALWVDAQQTVFAPPVLQLSRYPETDHVFCVRNQTPTTGHRLRETEGVPFIKAHLQTEKHRHWEELIHKHKTRITRKTLEMLT